MRSRGFLLITTTIFFDKLILLTGRKTPPIFVISVCVYFLSISLSLTQITYIIFHHLYYEHSISVIRRRKSAWKIKTK